MSVSKENVNGVKHENTRSRSPVLGKGRHAHTVLGNCERCNDKLSTESVPTADTASPVTADTDAIIPTLGNSERCRASVGGVHTSFVSGT